MKVKIFYFIGIFFFTMGILSGCGNNSQRSDGNNLVILENEKKIVNKSDSQSKIITAGSYKGHNWYIDEKHLLWWDHKPCVPYSINQIWIDHDKYPKSNFKEHYKMLDELTDELTKKGETYFVIFLTQPKIKSTADLFDPIVKAEFEEEWKKYAPAVAKAGLRGMTFLNEINFFSAPERYTFHDYQKILNEYAKNLKEIVGNVPVLLKIVGDWNIDPYMFAMDGDYIDGLGGDFFATYPDESLKRMMIKPVSLLKKSKKTKLFWITEFSRIAGQEPNNYWPAFESKEQMKAFLELFRSNGATGFFYFPIHHGTKGFAQVTHETAQWFRELKTEITPKILSPTD